MIMLLFALVAPLIMRYIFMPILLHGMGLYLGRTPKAKEIIKLVSGNLMFWGTAFLALGMIWVAVDSILASPLSRDPNGPTFGERITQAKTLNDFKARWDKQKVAYKMEIEPSSPMNQMKSVDPLTF